MVRTSSAHHGFLKKEGVLIIRLSPLDHQASYYPIQASRNVRGAAATASSPGTGNARAVSPDQDTYECQTCKNRKYQDGSNDPCVSFKTPTHISRENAPYAIRSHEGEHVAHAHAKAAKEDEKIISQSVTYHTSICPECGRTYMSGGTTRTVFQSSRKPFTEDPVRKGLYVDLIA